jgi:hypothetical protein
VAWGEERDRRVGNGSIVVSTNASIGGFEPTVASDVTAVEVADDGGRSRYCSGILVVEKSYTTRSS